MKEIICALLLAILLFGCSNAQPTPAGACNETKIILPHTGANETVCLSVNESGPYCYWKRFGHGGENGTEVLYFETGSCAPSGSDITTQVNYSDSVIGYTYTRDYSSHVGYQFEKKTYNCTRGACGFPFLVNYSAINFNYESENKPFENDTICFSNNTYESFISFDRDFNRTQIVFGDGFPKPCSSRPGFSNQ